MTLARRLAYAFVAVALAGGALIALGSGSAGAADPVGYAIVRGDSGCTLASVDLVTGDAQLLGTPSRDKCAFDLEFTPDGAHLLGTIVGEDVITGTAQLLEFNLTTGAVATVQQLGDFVVSGPGPTQGNLTFSQAGGLFTYLVPGLELGPDAQAVDPACDGTAFCLFEVNQADPTQLTYVNHVPQEFTVYFGLATSCAGVTSSAHESFIQDASRSQWDPAGAADIGDQTLATVNLTSTGPATADVGPLTDAFLTSMDYDTAGTLYAVGTVDGGNGATLVTVDPSTATTTTVATITANGQPLQLETLGFAIAHPCTTPPPPPPTPPTPPAPPTPAAVVVTPRFTG